MAKKTNTIQSLLEEAISNIQNSSDVDSKNYIPSIMEFCESEKYLDFRRRKIELYPVQKLILRAFYRGSRGNTSPDSMSMTEEEIELCKKLNLNGSKNGNILQKWNSNKNKQYFGTIIKIYPDKTVLPNGTSVYRQQSRRPDYAGSILARALKQVCLGYAK